MARELCQRWQWRTAQGRLKDFAARSLLLKLEARGLLGLPPLREQYQTRRWDSGPPSEEPLGAPASIEEPLVRLRPLRWSLPLPGSPEEGRVQGYLRAYHYLGLRVVGDYAPMGIMLSCGSN